MTLCLTKSYYQIRLINGSFEYTWFTTPIGLYHRKICPWVVETSIAVVKNYYYSFKRVYQPKGCSVI